MEAVAYAFGIVDRQTRHQISIIRKIRNRFAHDIFDVTFADANVHHLCRQLPDYHRIGDPKRCFVETANALYAQLLTMATPATAPS